jgi:titin
MVPTFTWAAPVNDGGGEILSYSIDVLRMLPGGASFEAVAQATLPAGTTTYSVPSAAVGARYYIKVRAVNSFGQPQYPNDSSVVLVATKSTPPRNLSLVAEDRKIDVSWQAPLDTGGGGFSWYQVTVEPTDRSAAANVSYIRNQGTTKTTIEGLTNGLDYSVSVVAVTNLSATVVDLSLSDPAAGTVVVAARPTVPTGVTLTPADGRLDISWTAPLLGATGYRVYITRPSNGGVVIRTVSGTSLSEAGLVNGETYYVQVSAVNVSGEGDKTTAVSKTVGIVPTAPTGLRLTPGVKSIAATWAATVSIPPILGYDVLWKPQGSSSNTLVPASGTSLTIADLLNSTAYDVSVRAVNAIGPGPYSSIATATTTGTLAAPTQVAAVPSGSFGLALVTWTPPYTPADQPIIQYLVKVNGVVQYTTQTSLTASGFGGGHSTQHSVSVAAETAAGVGAYSVPIQVPGAIANSPTGFDAVAGNGSVSLSWPTQANDGVPVLGFVLAYIKAGDATETRVTLPASATSYTASNLENGKLYNFWLTIVDAAGEGSRLNSLKAAIPIGTPDAVTGVTLSPRAKGMVISWTAPKSNSSIGITDYSIEYTPAGGSATVISRGGTTTTIGLYAKPPFGSPLYPPAVSILASTTYTIRVAARNDVGLGPWSSATTVTTLAASPPSAPTRFTVDGTAYSELELRWYPPSDAGSADIKGYIVNVAAVGQTAADVTLLPPAVSLGGMSIYTVRNLTHGANYNVRVSAFSDDGTGAAATVQASPAGGPVVTSLTAIGESAKIEASWGAPTTGFTGSSNELSYLVQVAEGTYGSGSSGLLRSLAGFAEYTTQNLSYTIVGVGNGKSYTVAVAPRKNGVVVGPYSYAATTTGGPPPAPAAFTATPTNSGMQLRWQEPADTYGKVFYPITKYSILIYSAGGTNQKLLEVTPNNTSYLHNGLTPNAAYWYTLTCENSKGVSPQVQLAEQYWSIRPTAVQGLATSVRGNAITANWAAPSDQGLEPALRYRVDISLLGRSGSELVDAPVTFRTIALWPVPAGSVSQPLGRGTYTISVTPINSSGTGPTVRTTATIV